MLGYFTSQGRGAGDALLAQVVETLEAEGAALAGVVQDNIEFDPERRCHMDLRVLGRARRVRISQDRGRFARGCRLDAQGLVDAVHQVEQALARGGVALLVVNKFSKAEAEGNGFRSVIAQALAQGVPVLTTVSEGNLAAFAAFAGDFAESVPAEPGAVLGWARAAMAGALPQDAA